MKTGTSENFLPTLKHSSDSPIEEKYLGALCLKVMEAEIGVAVGRVSDDCLTLFSEKETFGRVYVVSQAPLSRYRMDFMVGWEAPAGSGRVIKECAVECDGHDYHERTKDQAAHDRRRDRFFQAKGLPVLRFTGREIHRNPYSCASETLDFLTSDIVEKMMRARGG